MHKAHVSELFLSLFTSRERAASTVGDLMEDAPARGAAWFWLCVSRTALSTLWSGFAAEPFYLAGLGFLGLLVNLLLKWTLAIGMAKSGLPLSQFDIAYPAAFLLLINIAIPFQTGRWIAHRAHHRAMAAGVVYLILLWAVTATEAVIVLRMTGPQILLTNLAPLALFCGAIQARRQTYLRSGNAKT